VTSSHTSPHLNVSFNERRIIANAGLLLPTRLAHRLGIQELLDEHVDLGRAPGRAHVGQKLLTLGASQLVGGDCIDDAAALRGAGSAAVLGHPVAAPSTLGTFLRSFTWGHIKQLDQVSELALARAWRLTPLPRELTVDFDSTICETYGVQKQGAPWTYAKVRGYQPLLAITAGRGEVVHARLRGGNAAPARGTGHFVGEGLGRVRRAGFSGPLVARMDSGFYIEKVVRACQRYDARFSITARMYPPVERRLAEIPEDAWQPIPDWGDGTAEVAEIAYQVFANTHHGGPAEGVAVRLIVRRVLPAAIQPHLPGLGYRYHAFITDRAGTARELEADHRQHAVVETSIDDLKHGLGLNHLPSGRFAANAAWLMVTLLAHNLLRWLGGLLAGVSWQAKTWRHRLLSLPGRLVRSGRRTRLRLPAHWPWQAHFETVLQRLA
jgi:hypothetical protein